MHRSIVATKSRFFVPKSRKRYGCEMPAASAISSVDVPCRPPRANASNAAASTASRRSSAVCLGPLVIFVSDNSHRARIVKSPRCRGARRRAGGRRPPCGCLPRMDVLRPSTLEEALRLKAAHPEARPIQGGTDVMVELTFGHSRPDALLDLSELAELRGFTRGGWRASARLGPHVHGGDAGAARRAAAGARRGVAHRRLTADP